MSGAHDSWLRETLGIDVAEVVSRAKQAAASIVDGAGAAASAAGPAAGEDAPRRGLGLEGVLDGFRRIEEERKRKLMKAQAQADEVALEAIELAEEFEQKAKQPPAKPGGAALPQEAANDRAGSFPLGGSVGRGGRNAPGDVRAVQSALGDIVVDGFCAPRTVASIEAFQRSLGQAAPDGKVDAGGPTERALRERKPASAPAATPADARMAM